MSGEERASRERVESGERERRESRGERSRRVM